MEWHDCYLVLTSGAKGITYSFIINSHPTDSATIKIKTEKELITFPDQKKLTNKIQTLAPFQVLILKTK